MTKKTILAAGLILCLRATAWSIPQVLNFQGRLSESGSPVTGNRDMTFLIFDAPSNGNLLYTEVHNDANTISVSTGVFNTLIGSLTSGGIPLSVFDGNDKFIEVHVGSTVLPRQKIVSVGYAFRSQNTSFADQSSTASFALVAGALAGASTAVSVTTVTTNVLYVTTITVSNISIAEGTISITSGGMKIGHSIVLGPYSGTGADNTITFTNGAGVIATSGTDPIILSPGGNVGIGTSNPESSLHVSAGGITSGQGGATAGALKLYNAANANATTIQASDASASVVYKLPPADGQQGQVLMTDGNGNLSWASVIVIALTGIIPTSSPLGVSTPITLMGKGFEGGATVKIGGIAATNVVVVSDTQITALAPASNTAGAVSVVVSNPDGDTATMANGFVYETFNTACASGQDSQIFVPGKMAGCRPPSEGNTLTFPDAPALCASGFHLCRSDEYGTHNGLPNPVQPLTGYWLEQPSLCGTGLVMLMASVDASFGRTSDCLSGGACGSTVRPMANPAQGSACYSSVGHMWPLTCSGLIPHCQPTDIYQGGTNPPLRTLGGAMCCVN